MNDNDLWKIKNLIKNKKIDFNEDDIVVLFRKKGNGYPRQLKLGEKYYIIRKLDYNCVEISKTLRGESIMKIDISFVVHFNFIRDIKLNRILN